MAGHVIGRRRGGIAAGRRRAGWIGLLAVLALALGGVLVPTAAHAATGITLTSAAATAESGVATTFTLTVSCSTDGGCCSRFVDAGRCADQSYDRHGRALERSGALP